MIKKNKTKKILKKNRKTKKQKLIQCFPMKNEFYIDPNSFDCYENHKGIDLPLNNKLCGWYSRNDRKKVSNDFKGFIETNGYRKNVKERFPDKFIWTKKKYFV